ncbi:putative nuclease HARBI1 [Cucumis melo var. makuwa]|uniref:Nuclease HARBI1 n=1 Tax=Cucumis melo var. makuwa TaxID=1194695 RepID=A0A5D3CQK6_CUCMM|nr:putative nuclease HARBI1 [Cucumis melo var. makuwa]TYK13478.1 putative nuclease HARBI1 [Cucumis melo var. makuwa]
MDRRCVAILGHLLRTTAGLVGTKVIDVEEMVAMFLHILAHDVKNRMIQREFVRSGETVSRHFNLVLLAVLRLHDELLKKPQPNFLGALDGTYIKVNVSATVVQGLAADSRILGDAISRHNVLKVPKGFLASYRGERYHLSEWRGGGNAPTTAREFFNMKHSSARNVIERAFGLLKGHWTILRGKSYYPVDVQSRTIMVCCLLHNLINREMTNSEIINNLDEGDATYATTRGDEINYIAASNEWSELRDQLAHTMFSDWELRDQ